MVLIETEHRMRERMAFVDRYPMDEGISRVYHGIGLEY